MENINEIAKALMEFQSKVSVIEKNEQGYGYKYADLAQIVSKIDKPLKECNLAYSQLLGNEGEKVSVTTILMHETGQSLQSTASADIIIPLNKSSKDSMTKIQAQGSIITYLRRYALSAILGIVTDEDSDGNYNDKKPSTTDKKSTVPTKNPQKQPASPAKDVRDKSATWTENDISRAKRIDLQLRQITNATSALDQNYLVELKKLTLWQSEDGKDRWASNLRHLNSTGIKILSDKTEYLHKEYIKTQEAAEKIGL